MSTLKLIKDRKALTTAIAAISKTVEQLDTDIHTALCSALWHYIKPGKDKEPTGDLTFLTLCAKATSRYKSVTTDGDKKAQWDGRSVRGAAVRKWIEDFAGVRWSVAANDGEGGYRKSKSVTAVQPKDIDIDKAIATPFWDYSEDKAPEEFVPSKAATSLRDKLLLMIEMGQSKSGKTLMSEEYKDSAIALKGALDVFLTQHGTKAKPSSDESGTFVQDILAEVEADESKASAKKAKSA
jgi:hypothetical protein